MLVLSGTRPVLSTSSLSSWVAVSCVAIPQGQFEAERLLHCLLYVVLYYSLPIPVLCFLCNISRRLEQRFHHIWILLRCLSSVGMSRYPAFLARNAGRDRLTSKNVETRSISSCCQIDWLIQRFQQAGFHLRSTLR